MSAVLTRTHLTSLKLWNFRNYPALSLTLDARPVALAGPNGAGKTNLLEAVSFLAPGRGLRRAPYALVARAGGDGAWAVAAELAGREGPVAIGTGLAPGGDTAMQRRIRIDHAPARAADALTRHVGVLWLTPSMDGLFTGPAGDRRRFLDRLVLTLDGTHGTRVNAFEQALRGRNRLLEDARAEPAYLDAVEAEVAALGVAVAAARRDATLRLSGLIGEGEGDAFPRARIALEGAVEARLGEVSAAVVEDEYRLRLRDTRARDRAAGRTLDGPHRSDLVVVHAGKDMPAALGSTGEQKALLLGLVLAEARLVARVTGAVPLLLLDEVAAHLDAARRHALYQAVLSLGAQAFMTGTDAGLFAPLDDRAQRLAVENGTVRPA